MKKFIAFVFAFFFLSVVSAAASAVDATSTSAASRREPVAAVFDGTMMPIDLGPYRSLCLPDSLQPVFVNYVGRHGARFLSSYRKAESADRLLRSAKEAGTLTPAGKRLLALMDTILARNSGEWGLLSPEGKHEELVLGRSFAETYLRKMPRPADGVVRVEAISSFVSRVVETMNIFTYNLTVAFPDDSIAITTSSGIQYDPLMRYFVSNPAYVDYIKRGCWHEVYDDYVSRNISEQPAIRLLGNLPGMDAAKRRQFALDLYGVLQSMRATGLGSPSPEFLDAKEYESCWAATNLKRYFERTGTPLDMLPAVAAKPLLLDLMQHEQMALDGVNPIQAYLCFGHAETLLPLLSLMGVEGCEYIPTEPASDPFVTEYESVDKHWRDYEITPLGANVAIATLKAPSGALYNMVVLNGKPAKVAGRTVIPRNEFLNYLALRLAI